MHAGVLRDQARIQKKVDGGVKKLAGPTEYQ